jgi:uncharacterized protein (DUF2062 family)
MTELWNALVAEVGQPRAVVFAVYAALVLGWAVYLAVRLIAVLMRSRRQRRADEAAVREAQRLRRLDAVMRISGDRYVA